MSGQGCSAGSDVSVAIGDHPVGSSTADSGGGFSATVETPVLAPGEYQVSASCGVLLASPLDVVLGTSVRQGGTALALLAFFVLLSGLLLRRRLF